MPRYHFQTYEGDSAHGRESYHFPALASTWHGAAVHLGRLLPAIGADLFKDDLRLEVTNDDGLVLFSIMVVVSDMTTPRSR